MVIKCSCPHCAAVTEVSSDAITESGSRQTCTACKQNFWVYTESFGSRALKTSGELLCVACGSQLGHSIICPSCGMLYPAFHRTLKTQAVRRKTQKTRRSYVIARTPKVLPRRMVAAPKKTEAKSFRYGNYVIAAVAVLAVLTAGWFFVAQQRAEAAYAKSYMRVLYGIHSGTVQGLAICESLRVQGKAARLEKREFVVRVSDKDLSRMNRVRAEVVKLLAETAVPPKKFAGAGEQLAGLNAIYGRVVALVQAPPDTTQGLEEQSARLETEYGNAVKNLKAALPEKLNNELDQARKKYRPLRDF